MRRSIHSAALANAVAHELNNELTLILGNVTSPLPLEDKLAGVEGAALRCAGITRRLLAYSQRMAGANPPLPLATLLEQEAA